MAKQPTQSLDDLFRAEEDRQAAEANTPERIAADKALAERTAIKSEEERQAAIRLGWIDEDGNSLLPADEDEDEDEDSDDGEAA